MFKAFTQNKPIFSLIFLGFLLIGLSVAGYGVYSYFDAQSQIDDNLYYQTRESGEPLEIPNRPTMSSIAQQLFESQQKYQDLRQQEGWAIRYIGIGLALMGAGWLGADLSYNRFKSKVEDEGPPPEDSPDTTSNPMSV